MQKVLVNKKGNFPQLRILFPDLLIAEKDVPVYGKYIYSTFDYDSPKSTLFLLQDPSGFCLDTLPGLVNFLRHIEYMQNSKLERLYSGKRYSDKELVYSMYKEAVSLKISNRSFHKDEADLGFCIDMLKMKYYDRLSWAAINGYDKTLDEVLFLVEQYLSPNSTLKPFQLSLMGQVMSRFDRISFKKDFTITQDHELDCYLLLSYFG